MSEPVSSATVLAGGLMGASVFGLATGTDYGVVPGEQQSVFCRHQVIRNGQSGQ